MSAAIAAASRGRERTLASDARGQRLAVDQLHHQRRRFAGGVHVVDLDDHRVREAGGGTRLGHEPLARRLVGQEVGMQPLHGHVASELLVRARQTSALPPAARRSRSRYRSRISGSSMLARSAGRSDHAGFAPHSGEEVALALHDQHRCARVRGAPGVARARARPVAARPCPRRGPPPMPARRRRR